MSNGGVTMPVIRTLTTDELKAMEKKPGGNGARKAIEQEYDTLLADVQLDTWSRADLGDGDVKANVRNRMSAAAKRRGVEIEFKRTRDLAVIFRLVNNGAKK